MIDTTGLMEQVPSLFLQKTIEGFLVIIKSLLSVPNVFVVAIIIVLIVVKKHYE